MFTLPEGLTLAFCVGGGNDCEPWNKGTGADTRVSDVLNTSQDKAAKLLRDPSIKAVKDRLTQINKAIDFVNSSKGSSIYENGVTDTKIGDMVLNSLGVKDVALNKLVMERIALEESLVNLTKDPPDLRKEYEAVSEELDSLVTLNEGSSVAGMSEAEVEFSQLDDEVQDNAKEKYYNDSDVFGAAMASAEETIMGDIEHDIEQDLNKVEFTAQVLEDNAAELGIDPVCIDQIARSMGETESMYVMLADGNTGDKASEKFDQEIRPKFAELFKNEWDSEKNARMGDAKEGKDEAITESAMSYMDEEWDSKSNFEKMNWVDESDKVNASTLSIPDKYEPFENTGTDYTKTQTVARFIQDTRAREIMQERGIPEDVANKLTERFHEEVWSSWKSSSTDSTSKAVQLACADEFGSPTRPEYEAHRKETYSNGGFIREDEQTALKAYLRATWESSQHVLDKAGVNEVNTWRAVFVPDSDLAATRQDLVVGSDGVSRRKIPDIELLRNGAQSTSFGASVPNGWGGAGNTSGKSRVVLRIDVKPTAVLSLPAHGQNVQAEQETILTGRDWLRWDAWINRAPNNPIERDKPSTQVAWAAA